MSTPVARGPLFGWMALGGAVGGILGAFVSTIVTAPTAFDLVVTAVYLVAIVPLAVAVAAVAFAGDVVGQSRHRDGVLVPVLTSVLFAVVVLGVGLLALEWLRNALFIVALAGAALFAIGGGFVARARAARPKMNAGDAMPTWDEPSS